MGRSSAYWSSNLYTVEEEEPVPTAPLTDLSAPLAARFRALRTGLLAIEEVAEQIRFMGSVDVTFTLTENDENRLGKGPKLAKALARAIEEGQRTGPVKWCWLELEDRRAVDAFLSLARRKAAWLAERPAPRRAPRLHGGGASSSEAEAD